MSHSQFHSTNLFILRHAWLNLWDKHMTTGRINQVTISVCTESLHHARWHKPLYSTSTYVRRRFPRRAFVTRLWLLPLWIPPQLQRAFRPRKNVLSTAVTSRRNTLYPDLTSFKQALLVQRTKITAFSEDYQQPAAPEKMRAVTAYLRLV